MAETRSVAAVRESVEESLSSKFESLMEERMADLNKKFDSKIDSKMGELFEAMRLFQSSFLGNISPRNRPPGSNDPTTSYGDGQRHQLGGELEPRRGGISSPSYSGLTRLSRLDFPRFNGDKVKEWIFKCDQFFSLDRTPNDLKIQLASIHFEDVAASWHQSLALSEPQLLRDWESYKSVLLDRFGDMLDDPIADLKNLQETESIVEYHNKFELIRTRVQMSEEYLVSAYLAGLRNDTQMHVRMFRPAFVRQCYMLGKLYESAHPRRPSFAGSSQRHGSIMGKPPMMIKKEWSTESKAVGDTKANENSGRKFLSQAEMSDRRAKGLCYFCDEKYTPTHYLKHKKTQLFSMEVDEEDVSFSEVDDSVQPQESGKVEISVNAMAGIVGYRTMRVKDSGSTHNFIDKNVVAKLGCSISSIGITKVTVADGSSIDVVAKVEDFSWTFQDIPFHAEAMVLPLGCCDMVLGIQWLETLGPVIWDFKKLTMEFRLGQRRVVLHGLQSGFVREVKAHKLLKHGDQGAQMALIYVQQGESNIQCCNMEQSKSAVQYPEVRQVIVELEADPSAKKHFVWKDGLLRRKNKLVIANSPELKDKLLTWLHSSGLGGHSGRDATIQRVKSLFYWKGMSKSIQQFIRSCVICQQNKYDTAASPGLLQPLPIPGAVWSEITMDFIDGLPPSFGKSVIFVVVDRLSKAAHFMALAHPYSASSVAQCFLDNIFKLHGLPVSITSDRDAVFLSEFWRELLTIQGVQLNFSSAYHPQTDGQTEVVNRCLETYLRCMCSDRPYLWSIKFLSIFSFLSFLSICITR
ncbi:hypothetical protein V2J09_013481 [Rumex salicifolius]